MKQRSDARAAQFLRPNLVQIIEWKFNAHVALLSQRGNSGEL